MRTGRRSLLTQAFHLTQMTPFHQIMRVLKLNIDRNQWSNKSKEKWRRLYFWEKYASYASSLLVCYFWKGEHHLYYSFDQSHCSKKTVVDSMRGSTWGIKLWADVWALIILIIICMLISCFFAFISIFLIFALYLSLSICCLCKSSSNSFMWMAFLASQCAPASFISKA